MHVKLLYAFIIPKSVALLLLKSMRICLARLPLLQTVLDPIQSSLHNNFICFPFPEIVHTNKFYVSALKCLQKIANEIVYLSNVILNVGESHRWYHFVDNAVQVFNNNYLHLFIQKNSEFWASDGQIKRKREWKEKTEKKRRTLRILQLICLEPRVMYVTISDYKWSRPTSVLTGQLM